MDAEHGRGDPGQPTVYGPAAGTGSAPTAIWSTRPAPGWAISRCSGGTCPPGGSLHSPRPPRAGRRGRFHCRAGRQRPAGTGRPGDPPVPAGGTAALRHVRAAAGIGLVQRQARLPLDQADSSRRPHMPQRSSPASRYRRVAGPAGPRGALASCAAMNSCLAHQRGVGRPSGDDPPGGQVPPLHLLMAQPGVGRVDQIAVGALPVPHWPARYTGGWPGSPRPCSASTPSRTGAGCAGGSAADGHGIAASLSARVMRAMLCPASR